MVVLGCAIGEALNKADVGAENVLRRFSFCSADNDTPDFASAFRLLVNCWRASVRSSLFSSEIGGVDCSVCCACWILVAACDNEMISVPRCSVVDGTTAISACSLAEGVCGRSATIPG